MPMARRLAFRWLNAVVRSSPPESRPWGDAMLRELEVVESDWGALSWALGGTAALFRHSVGRRLETIGRKAAGILSGVVIAAAVLTLSVRGLLELVPLLSPGSQLGNGPVGWMFVLVIPEAVFVVTAVRLWRSRRSMAMGLLLAAMTLITHVVVHVATHG